MNDHPNPMSSMPLALLDGARIDAEDMIRVSLLGRGKLGDPSMELGVRENREQRWVYYPLMELDEAIIMRQFEWETALGADQGGRYRCPLHVGFKDPSAPPSSLKQNRAAHIYRFMVWTGDEAPPPLYTNKGPRRNHRFESGILSGGTDDDERVQSPLWSRTDQLARAVLTSRL